ncbi:sulfatase [uncultured Maribacter sp.]|uniref:sulfatase family protein n=1 Tax=uncultured Maribacter sp. TaxID=431308 RepID=UPI00261F6AA2|nr:sulfatase [uncultured Maribacter sp.]
MKIFKKALLGLAILLTLNCTTAQKSAVKETSERPNIIWIMLEDWSPDLSCYGTKGIETPVTDKLTSQGVKYTNAFCTAPVCSASRSAMMTGFHQDYIGGEEHRLKKEEKKPLPYGIKPMPLLLKEAGYYTALMASNKTDCNFDADMGFMGKDWKNKEKDQPFFAQITLQGTHRQWERDPINPIDPKNVELPPYYVDTPFARRDWANGLEQMQICDREIGVLLDRLDKEKLTDNTLVFLIGDNGRCHIRGKQFLYDPGLQVPLIIKWPGKVKPNQVNENLVQTIDITATILEVAGVTPPQELQGKNLFKEEANNRAYIFAARSRMGSTHDAMRTIRSKKYKLIHNLMPERAWLQYSGYKEDMYPMLAEMNILNMEGKLNDIQAKFFAPTKPEFELYDIINDPYEVNNLAMDINYAGIKDTMLAELYSWRKEIKDKGVSKEFRMGGTSSKYPTRTLEEWKVRYEKWKPWVNRKPNEKIEHPFVKKHY